MVQFAIRDDDTSYFTRPEELESCYSSIWDTCPVSLSVVPFHACTKSGGVPREYWKGDKVFPLEDNGALVAFLREGIQTRRIHVTLHGYHHRDEPNGYEFAAGPDLARKVVEGKRYLEELLGQPIRVFVPPHNSLGREGYRAVVGAGLHISGIQTFKPSFRGWDPRVFCTGVRRWMSRRRGGGCVPWPVAFPDGHREFPHVSLTPPVSVESMLGRFDEVLKTGGVFCVATHYWEFDVSGRGHPHTIRQVLAQLWGKVMANRDQVRFVTLSELAGLQRAQASD
jgi:hypothetical protein